MNGRISGLVLSVALSSGFGVRAEDPAGKGGVGSDGVWHTVVRSDWAVVSVERVFYEREGSPHFFVQVRITNPGAVPRSVDLRDYEKVIYPNQWGVLRTDERGIIDERRIIIAPPDEFQKKEIIEAQGEGKLTTIPAGGTFAYFREFNASGRRDVEKQESDLVGAKNIYVSMDGHLLFTDGDDVGQVSLTWDGEEEVSTDVIVPVPMTWLAVPEKAFVVEDR